MDSSNSYPKETSGRSIDGESSSSNLNRFLDLPEDVTANILCRLGAYEILKNAQRVCSLWRNICKDSSMWLSIDMRRRCGRGYLDGMCRQAVDRSQGQLIELHIDYSDIDQLPQLLDYISERSSKLRCLEIRDCDVVDDQLIKATKKFPLLEELHFSGVIRVKGSIEPIGRSCLMLKSFTLNSSNCKRKFWGHEDDDEYDVCDNQFVALPIAKSMPGLRHLRLVGANMTNSGLEAIHDGCPNLESLDIRKCFNVFCFPGGICDTISQRIRDFKGPHDPMELSFWDSYLLAVCSDSDSSDEFASFYRW